MRFIRFPLVFHPRGLQASRFPQLNLRKIVAANGKAAGRRQIETFTTHRMRSLDVPQIEPTDMLVIDTVHHADRLTAELERFAPSVKRWIVLRGTGAFGQKAEGGNGPGLLVGLRRYMEAHPEWFPIYHTSEQYGLTDR